MTASIISHRGGALLWPENSRIACEQTVALGCGQLQVDVHLSRDGEVVVIHDATLDRTTDGAGPVAARSWDELRRLRLKDTPEQSILLLREVIGILAPSAVTLRLEIKQDASGHPYDRFAEHVDAVLRGKDFIDRTIVTGFHPDALQNFAAASPGRRLAWLVDGATLGRIGVPSVIEQATRFGFPTVGLRWSLVDQAAIEAIRASGLALCLFGCNDLAGIEAAVALGADEIMTDRPDLAMQISFL